MAEPDQAVVDATVAVRWFVAEPGSAAALALLARPTRWHAPHLLLTEVTDAIARKHGEGLLLGDEPRQAVGDLLALIEGRGLELADDARLIQTALEIGLRFPHRIADCLYVALAQTLAIPLVTADEKQARIARAETVTVHLLATP